MPPFKAFAIFIVLYAGLMTFALLGSRLPVCVPRPPGLSECRQIGLYFQVLAMDRGGPVSVATLSPTDRQDFRQLRNTLQNFG